MPITSSICFHPDQSNYTSTCEENKTQENSEKRKLSEVNTDEDCTSKRQKTNPENDLSSSIAKDERTYNDYFLGNENKIESIRRGGRGNGCHIIKYQDDSEWIFLSDKGKERFCGFLYLQEELEKLGEKLIRAANNKMTIHQDKIIYLSEYCGEQKAF